MKQVRFGIVGVGVIGNLHARVITAAKDRSFRLAAVADIHRSRAKQASETYGVPCFLSGQEMFESGQIDAVIIATPHYWHPVLAIQAARAGLHALTEKPMASSVGPARAMIAECRKRKVALGVMFQMRAQGVMMKMKQMVDAGRLGEVFRVSMICSSWYRTQFYYNSGAWRGTWDGEGGGVLINQAPHNLDVFAWIGGMPKSLIAAVDTRLHKIEVENTANVICDYGRGKHGYIYATTAEAPGLNQLMVCGDKGTLVAEGGKLRFAKLKMPISRHIMTSREMFTHLSGEWSDVKITKDPGGGHINVTRNFAQHIRRGKPLLAPGSEGVNELELSNAVYLSGYENRPVKLPVNAKEMEKLLDRLVRTRSTGKGRNLRAQASRELTRLLGKYPA
ncbi:MAG TPA: Gfo/Idh/MocA family oxidoreductase [Phycisphaerae bacterium]|nr:Gfo/Idh/MocA family oxidoreductase [Phycisphaerae bacterium]